VFARVTREAETTTRRRRRRAAVDDDDVVVFFVDHTHVEARDVVAGVKIR
jgi:hypothetical protein